jgi:ribosomal protein L15E
MKNLSSDEKVKMLLEHKQSLLDLLEHEIRNLEHLQWRAVEAGNKEKYYNKILLTREIQTIINNL